MNGFGFLWSVSPGAATLRGGKRAADHAGLHRPTERGASGRWTAVFRG